MSLAEVGNILERRILSLCDNTLSYVLPPMLVGELVLRVIRKIMSAWLPEHAGSFSM